MIMSAASPSDLSIHFCAEQVFKTNILDGVHMCHLRSEEHIATEEKQTSEIRSVKRPEKQDMFF